LCFFPENYSLHIFNILFAIKRIIYLIILSDSFTINRTIINWQGGKGNSRVKYSKNWSFYFILFNFNSFKIFKYCSFVLWIIFCNFCSISSSLATNPFSYFHSFPFAQNSSLSKCWLGENGFFQGLNAFLLNVLNIKTIK